jgi:hypothetical protein
MRLFALLLAISACTTEMPEEVGYGSDFGTPESPVPQEQPYAVTTKIDLGFGATRVAETTADMKAFAQNPAKTLLAQGGPALQSLLTALPSSLEDRLEGWLNTEIDKARIAGKTLREFAAEVAASTETSLTQFSLESSLEITPTGATHTLSGLNFRPSGLDIIIPVGGLKADSLSQTTTATLGTYGAVTLGTQRFGLGFGAHVWHGINLASETLYGGDVEVTLAQTLNCRAIAQALATKCLNGVCVGHASDVEGICTAAAGLIVDELAERIAGFQIASFQLVHGTGRLVDNDRNGVGEEIADGTWTADVDVGYGSRTITASFTALD